MAQVLSSEPLALSGPAASLGPFVILGVVDLCCCHLPNNPKSTCVPRLPLCPQWWPTPYLFWTTVRPLSLFLPSKPWVLGFFFWRWGDLCDPSSFLPGDHPAGCPRQWVYWLWWSGGHLPRLPHLLKSLRPQHPAWCRPTGQEDWGACTGVHVCVTFSMCVCVFLSSQSGWEVV